MQNNICKSLPLLLTVLVVGIILIDRFSLVETVANQASEIQRLRDERGDLWEQVHVLEVALYNHGAGLSDHSTDKD